MAKPNDIRALIDLTKSTQSLLAHFDTSLKPATTTATAADPTAPQVSSADLPNPLDVVKACTTLLKSHTTTLSLLLLTPPLTPSALITKIGDVNSGPLSGLVAAAIATPRAGEKDELGALMRAELKVQARRLIGTWEDLLAIVLRLAEKRQNGGAANTSKKDDGVTESERQDVLAATGVVWEACDALLKLCADGVVGLVVKKAQELRSTLLDAAEELKEWGEDVDDDEDDAEGSDGEFADEDGIFSAANKLGKDDKELKALLDRSVKKLKMVGILYQALIKRRLKPFPTTTAASALNGDSSVSTPNSMAKLDELMNLLKAIPETVDDLASAFYDLDEDEAKQMLEKCSADAQSAIALVKQSWTGSDDEFTAWSSNWISVYNAA